VELLKKLAERDFASTPIALKQTLTQFFSRLETPQKDKKLRKTVESVRTSLARLNATN